MEKIAKQTKNKGGNPAWKKGVSGNPNGRPPGGTSIAEKFRKVLAEKSILNAKITREDMIIHQAVLDAEKGDDKAREFVMNRAHGKVPDKVITHEDTDGLIVKIG